MIGKEVRNPQGKNIGRIRDMVVDMNIGHVRYAQLEFDPGNLRGERLFAVPTHLDRAWRDTDCLSRMDKAWGVMQPSDKARAYRVSDLLGMDVNSRSGEEIGEVEELVIDMASRVQSRSTLAPSCTSLRSTVCCGNPDRPSTPSGPTSDTSRIRSVSVEPRCGR